MGCFGKDQLQVQAITPLPAPTAEEQLEFLQRIQSLFEDGNFSATYKYALLMALAELVVELGEDNGNELSLDMAKIGEKFAELYWPQTVQYVSGVAGTLCEVLKQNHGAQAGAINELLNLREAGANTLSKAKSMPNWPSAVHSITETVRAMPLKHLQVFGGRQVPFLYDYPLPHTKLVLKVGVMFNLRTFHSLIQQLARNGWISHIRKIHYNREIVGPTDDLEGFMFGTSRSSLQAITPVLARMQSGRCFYCAGDVRTGGHVDHFIPWSKYSRDLAHNFVLAHTGCNSFKSDMLAARIHLDNWVRRNEKYGVEIAGQFGEAGFVGDEAGILSVASWAYGQAVTNGGIAWVESKVTEPVSAEYLSVFS